MSNNLLNEIETLLGERIVGRNSKSGGCINNAEVVSTESGKKYFLKSNFSHPADMFLKEANGLAELTKSSTIRIPNLIGVGKHFILLENIESSSKIKNFYEDFGRKFADLHKFTNDNFGFFESNYIGSTPQINIASDSEKSNWAEFYFNKRILFQFKLAGRNGYSDERLRDGIKKLESIIHKIIGNEIESPSLLHGDLWSGNYIVDENGKACLIDPAVYYGNREADLAMTKLFSGFSPEFYSSYNEHFPLSDGHEFRENIYKLYHILNHLNLFGTSYYSQAVGLIEFYTK